jgi:hypothetical protein
MFRFRYLAAAAAAAVVVGGFAPAAMADTPTPTATPSVAAPVVTPSPAPLRRLHLRPETFIIHSSTAEPAGDGVFVGPVHGASVGNFDPGADVESLTGPTGTVELFHTALAPLVIDWATCTASADSTGRWALVGLSGADRRAFGFGTYRASEFAILARGFFGQCLGLRVAPVDTDTHVIGTGRAVQLHRGFFAPRLTPSLLPAS